MVAPNFGFDWIPYEYRGAAGQRLTDEFNERIQTFGDVGSTVEIPNQVTFAALERQHFGKLLPRVQQITGSCLLPGAMVKVPGGEVPISQLNVGDVVISHRGHPRRVTEVLERKDSNRQLYEFRANGAQKPLIVTEDHVVGTLHEAGCKCNTNIRWKRGNSILKGEKLLLDAQKVSGNAGTQTRYGTALPVQQITQLGLPETSVWDINVEGDHSFIADGYVVHNCVGSGAAVAYLNAMTGDVVFRGDNEEVKPVFPFATYGVGREIAGMRGAGEGSFGAAQAKAVDPDRFGYLPWDHPKVPKPIQDGYWWKWTKAIELEWSHPRAWKQDYEELRKDAGNYGIEKVTRIRSVEEWIQALAQGYGVSFACMFGTRQARIEHGLLVGRWNTSWAHQQSSFGYILDWEGLGTVIGSQNQWGRFHASHQCEVMGPLGMEGAYWIVEQDAERICREGEVFAHTSTGNFEPRLNLWDFWQFG